MSHELYGELSAKSPEFAKIYNLDVVVIPTNKELIRHEYADVVYRTEGSGRLVARSTTQVWPGSATKLTPHSTRSSSL